MVSLPSEVLDTPYPKEPIPGLVNEILGAGDWLSPSHVLMKGIELVFSFAREYQSVAAGMQEMATAVASILEQLLDKLISMGIKALAATATSETVIGGLFFGGWAAYDAYRATRLWTQALEWHGRALTASQALVGLCAGYLGALRDLDSITLPNAYDHPGAQG